MHDWAVAEFVWVQGAVVGVRASNPATSVNSGSIIVAYLHLIIMLFATLGEFVSLRKLEQSFIAAANRMNRFGLDYMVRRSTLSDANAWRGPAFFEAVFYSLYARYRCLLSDGPLVERAAVHVEV